MATKKDTLKGILKKAIKSGKQAAIKGGKIAALAASGIAAPAVYSAYKYKKELEDEKKSHEMVGKLSDKRRSQIRSDRKWKNIKSTGRGWGEPSNPK